MERFHIHINPRSENAPIATSGDNIFVVWWTDKTGNNNDEVFFRASTRNGQTFGDKVSLSNSTNRLSRCPDRLIRKESACHGGNVIQQTMSLL